MSRYFVMKERQIEKDNTVLTHVQSDHDDAAG